ncbi:peptidase [Staphylococcus piscifermentans]|uniref:Dipeptidyl aminopeptidase n=1 Tax=Staphylococcus piscifermentans TaxID=70258 RepID=A0A239TZB0_9STAP|nr:prolyl oligopeptidase family serine peptidase [Staphylococcus piscifermentans]GEP84388.1 dipeptidyl aminopeptidase [Staphylococcus piscifermentans]SNV02922.1 peptidase [Staphylococcus piscifermentans]
MDFINRKRMPIDLASHIGEEVTYEVDHLKVKGLMLSPKEKVQRIVIYLRGGKGKVGRVRTGRLLQFSDPHTLVFGPYYRGNNGSEGRDEFSGNDLHDVTQAMDILKYLYPEAYVHLVGFSRGGLQGLLTFQYLPADSYIIWGGVSDLHLMYEERVDLRGMLRRMVGHPKKNLDAYEKREALQYIDENSPPILIIHGGKDKQVGIHQGYYLAEYLERIGHRYETFYQMQEGHVPRPEALKEVLEVIHKWMDCIENNK